tara:strand:+ start:739 stop:2079 length:1341 start_codon:yes stop_codon:yes gene_type:complete
MFFLIIGCEENNIIKIPLKQESNSDIAFETYNSTFPFMFYHKEFKEFHTAQLSKYRLLPNVDVQYIASSILDFENFIYQLKLKNQISGLQYQELVKQTNLNSELEAKKKQLIPENILVGLKNDEVFIVYDKNKNFDFTDDDIDYFEQTKNQITLNPSKLLGNLSTLEITQHYYINDTLEKYNRKIKLFPYKNYFAFQRESDSVLKKLGTIGYFQDFYKGEFNSSGELFEIAIQGLNRLNAQILIKSKNSSFNFHKSDETFNYNYSYRVGDTVAMNKNAYLIEALGSSFESISLKKIKIEKSLSKGRIGEKVTNYNFKNISEKKIDLLPQNTKPFLLLEFWGTWCGPCKEMTPKIVALKNEFTNKVDVIGFANDKSNEIVHDYIIKNKMNWEQVLVNENTNQKILKELKITAYPTYILINKNLEVLFRGNSESSLEEITTIITNRNN